MQSKQQTPPIIVPFDGEPAELIAAGRAVEELRESAGYAALRSALNGYREMIENRIASATPTANPAYYADAVGEKRGLASVDQIARGIVENAKAAERAEKESA